MMKTAVYGRCSGIENVDALQLPLHQIKDSSELLIYEPFLSYLQEIAEFKIPECTTFSSPDDLDSTINYMLSIGGDGTFLEAAQFAVEHGIPILGINFGRLGFLAQVQADGIESALDNLFRHEYDIEKRSLISVCTETGVNYKPYALNEITIQRNGPAMLKSTVWIDDKLLSSYWSDGLLVSTPTGSTAYSLSAGGPVATPDARSFIITPIAPHNLNIRPIIISDDSEIIIHVQTRKGNATLSVDNTMFDIEPDARLIVQKSDSYLNFIKLKDYDFFKTLHTKLHWGIDARNY